MTPILLRSDRLATNRDTERADVMRHHNTVFAELLKHVPWSGFERLVEKHGSDYRVRRLSTKSQLIALIQGQLSGAASLRAIVTGQQSHAARLYHLGAKPAQRSTLADANASRPSELFAELLALLMKQAHRGLRRKMAETTFLIDSTSLRLNALSSWACFSAGVFGAKVHVVYDPNADRPVYSVVSAANVNDITAAHAMPIVPGATYVFDLGYYDYRWWAQLDAQGCRIVTRLKSNTPLALVKELPVAKGSNILSDRIGYLPARQAASRRNPFQDPVREVRVLLDTGKVIRILCNDLDATAEQIADLYKQRWAIELFFRWIKQVLKIKTFFGTSENAVRIQVAVALITFLLLRLAQATQATVSSPLAFARLVAANLMQRRPIDQLLGPEPPRVRDPDQMELQWT